jgi:hypothetical protein
MLIQIRDSTGESPPSLLARPSLKSKWQYPFEVYAMLSGSRRYSMAGAAPIPLSEFVAFATLFRLRGWHAWEVWEDVRLIDMLTLAAKAKLREATKTEKN